MSLDEQQGVVRQEPLITETLGSDRVPTQENDGPVGVKPVLDVSAPALIAQAALANEGIGRVYEISTPPFWTTRRKVITAVSAVFVSAAAIAAGLATRSGGGNDGEVVAAEANAPTDTTTPLAEETSESTITVSSPTTAETVQPPVSAVTEATTTTTAAPATTTTIAAPTTTTTAAPAETVTRGPITGEWNGQEISVDSLPTEMTPENAQEYGEGLVSLMLLYFNTGQGLEAITSNPAEQQQLKDSFAEFTAYYDGYNLPEGAAFQLLQIKEPGSEPKFVVREDAEGRAVLSVAEGALLLRISDSGLSGTYGDPDGSMNPNWPAFDFSSLVAREDPAGLELIYTGNIIG